MLSRICFWAWRSRHHIQMRKRIFYMFSRTLPGVALVNILKDTDWHWWWKEILIFNFHFNEERFNWKLKKGTKLNLVPLVTISTHWRCWNGIHDRCDRGRTAATASCQQRGCRCGSSSSRSCRSCFVSRHLRTLHRFPSVPPFAWAETGESRQQVIPLSQIFPVSIFW